MDTHSACGWEQKRLWSDANRANLLRPETGGHLYCSLWLGPVQRRRVCVCPSLPPGPCPRASVSLHPQHLFFHRTVSLSLCAPLRCVLSPAHVFVRVENYSVAKEVSWAVGVSVCSGSRPCPEGARLSAAAHGLVAPPAATGLGRGGPASWGREVTRRRGTSSTVPLSSTVPRS